MGVGVEAPWPAMAAVEKGTNAARSRPVRVRLMPRSYPVLCALRKRTVVRGMPPARAY